jgi:hypothetical protein
MMKKQINYILEQIKYLEWRMRIRKHHNQMKRTLTEKVKDKLFDTIIEDKWDKIVEGMDRDELFNSVLEERGDEKFDQMVDKIVEKIVREEETRRDRYNKIQQETDIIKNEKTQIEYMGKKYYRS